jgi:hypothetical protein
MAIVRTGARGVRGIRRPVQLSHRPGPHRLIRMGTLATSAELWAVVGTTIVTVLLLVPGVVYAWYVLESWIDDDDSYARVIASIEKR